MSSPSTSTRPSRPKSPAAWSPPVRSKVVWAALMAALIRGKNVAGTTASQLIGGHVMRMESTVTLPQTPPDEDATRLRRRPPPRPWELRARTMDPGAARLYASTAHIYVRSSIVNGYRAERHAGTARFLRGGSG